MLVRTAVSTWSLGTQGRVRSFRWACLLMRLTLPHPGLQLPGPPQAQQAHGTGSHCRWLLQPSQGCQIQSCPRSPLHSCAGILAGSGCHLHLPSPCPPVVLLLTQAACSLHSQQEGFQWSDNASLFRALCCRGSCLFRPVPGPLARQQSACT